VVLKVRTKVKALSGCPMSKYTALLGGVWAPELLWSLSDGPRRFLELRRYIPVIPEKVLTARLRDLEKRGVLGRNMMPISPPTVDYELTTLGRELLPVIRSIVEVRAPCLGGCRRSGRRPWRG
jgi:DNA-binding HxlR family transcriptional regulator